MTEHDVSRQPRDARQHPGKLQPMLSPQRETNQQTNKNPLNSRNSKKGYMSPAGPWKRQHNHCSPSAAPLPPVPSCCPAAQHPSPGRANILQKGALLTHTPLLLTGFLPSLSSCQCCLDLHVLPGHPCVCHCNKCSPALQLMQGLCSDHCERRAEIRAEKTKLRLMKETPIIPKAPHYAAG